MAGLVIGSLITRYSGVSPSPRALAITVNNGCNLSCPHCYLQYDAQDNFISDDLIGSLCHEPVEHVAFVGMEPFKDRVTSVRTIRLARKLIAVGKKVSAITNGLNLYFCTDDELALFDFIDVSLDGGRHTYQQARGAAYDKILKQMRRLENANISYNILNTIYGENVANIDDMLSVFEDCSPENIYFNPYVNSSNDGINSVASISLFEHLEAFANRAAFLNEPRAKMLFDRYNCGSSEIEFSEFRSWVNKLSLTNKVHLVPHTPLTLGILRLTYDGIILSPDEAMHPHHYPKCHRYTEFHDLQDFYQWAVDRENKLYQAQQIVAAE